MRNLTATLSHMDLPRRFASRNASATRSSAGPSYGLPGQPAKPRTASQKVAQFYAALWTYFAPPLTIARANEKRWLALLG